jgi:uncharacterized protein
MSIARFELLDLKNWLISKDRKPLILRGARQVGKSTLVRQLAKHSYKQLLEINLERMPEIAEYFASQQPKQIWSLLQLHFNHSYQAQDSLLFLDEIQATPKIIACLRYFYEEFKDLAIICAGSLLDLVLMAPEFSVPVGRIEYYYLQPLSFENFLCALGEPKLQEWLNDYNLSIVIPQALHMKILEYVKLYWLIGGMPAVVAAFNLERDFNIANKLKHGILQTYQDDLHKYGRIKQLSTIRRVLQAVPGMIGKQIKYSALDPDSKTLDVRLSLEYLTGARIINTVYHASANGLPLRAQINIKKFKLLFLDCGLQNAAMGLNNLEFLQARTTWAWYNKGALAEQFIGQNLYYQIPKYQAPELFFWVREQYQAHAEIDYLWQWQDNIIPIEVKAGSSGTLKSLHYFMEEKQCSIGVRFNAEVASMHTVSYKLPNTTVKKEFKLLSLPFYLVGQLNRLLLK